jgi:PKD repeat protein
MRLTRTWVLVIVSLIAASSLVFSACSSCEPSKPAKPAASPAVGQPPAAPAAAASPGAEADVDELYVDAEAEPDEGPPPLSVKFTSTVEDATGALTYDWDFGDATPHSTDANPSHTYQKEGDYVATLKVVDSKGVKGETEVDITASSEE